MKFKLDIGQQEQTQIEYSRNWFLGTERILANGHLIASRSATSPSTHFSFTRFRRYEFTVGSSEPQEVVIEKERPQFFAGFRPHIYRVFVDGKLVHEQRGY